MKKAILFIVLILCALNYSQAQEWMTSLDIAKRLALVQNKMLLVMWENATLDKHPVLIEDQNGSIVAIDLFDIESLNEIVWKYYVPVIINESNYLDLFDEIKGKRKENYILKFNDDSIKIMDVNGNIINTNTSDEYNLINISSLIAKYSLDTSFLRQDLISYSSDKNFFTSYYLASKYIDFVSFNDKEIRSEIIELSNIYLDEAIDYLESNTSYNKKNSVQAIKLLRIKQHLFLNNPKKVLRQLKKIKNSEVHQANKSLFNFLHYTAFELLNDEKNALLWKNKVSLVDLKKAQYILN